MRKGSVSISTIVASLFIPKPGLNIVALKRIFIKTGYELASKTFEVKLAAEVARHIHMDRRTSLLRDGRG